MAEVGYLQEGQTSLLLEVSSNLLFSLRVRKALAWTRPVPRLQRYFTKDAGWTVFAMAEQSYKSHALLVPLRQHSKPCSVLFLFFFFSLCTISKMVSKIRDIFTQFINNFPSYKT